MLEGLIGILIGVGATFLGISIRKWYYDWRMRQNWIIAGRRWMEIANHVSSTEYKEQSPSARAADLEMRVALMGEGIPLDFEAIVESLNDPNHPERLSIHIREEHDKRIAEIEQRSLHSQKETESIRYDSVPRTKNKLA